ncbi:MAG TPA: hypothetical protein VN257_04155 [Actinotalea sp.]|nr:hypothetical protein [Actinotalea sp.]
MTVPGEVRPPESLVDGLARVTDGFFRDPQTGRITIYAKPNAKIKAVGVLVGASRTLRAAHVVDPGDLVDVLLERAAMAVLLWWSVDQLLHGTTKYLRAVGGVTLVAAIMRTVLGERSRQVSRA